MLSECFCLYRIAKSSLEFLKNVPLLGKSDLAPTIPGLQNAVPNHKFAYQIQGLLLKISIKYTKSFLPKPFAVQIL